MCKLRLYYFENFHEGHHVGVRLVQEFVKFALGLLVPMPGVLEGFNLRLAVVAARRFEEQVVVALGIERRVEIDEVNGFVRNVLAKDLEIVAVIELVHWRGSVRGKIGGVNLRSSVWRGSRFTSSGLRPPSHRMRRRNWCLIFSHDLCQKIDRLICSDVPVIGAEAIEPWFAPEVPSEVISIPRKIIFKVKEIIFLTWPGIFLPREKFFQVKEMISLPREKFSLPFPKIFMPREKIFLIKEMISLPRKIANEVWFSG
jgi:hypothetical protein